MTSAPDCLDEETVARFVDGSLEGEGLEACEAHLATCDACVRLVVEVGSALHVADATTAGAGPDDRAPLVAGARVGRYVIEGPLGAGAMGRVYSAHDPALDRRVALKLLHQGATTPEMEARLLREAKAMARVTHPEIITVHDAGTHGGQLFIAMELVEGGTLRDWCGARSRSWREILAVYTRAGRGLAQAHAAGIVHRDFKPDNVLVGVDGRVRVTDFGLARSADDAAIASSRAGGRKRGGAIGDDLTGTGALIGTPVYMAPEQLTGTPADVRSDIYAFCVALYEALYGVRPFPATTLTELFEEKLAGRIAAPPAGRGVPPRVRRALLAGLAPRAADRTASMNALLDALDRGARAFPTAIAVGVAAAGALAAGAWITVARGRHDAERPTASIVAAPAGCASDRACSREHGGAPFTCRTSDHACVAIASVDCEPRFEPSDLDADDTLWLGAMLPTKGPNAAAFGTMNMDGAELARREIAQATAALAGSTASQRVRRIALVACDDGVDPMRAAKHLVDDVGVPAILGFGSGKEIEDVAGSLLVKRGVLTIASVTSSPLVTRLPQPADLPRMVWRTTYSIEAAALATAHLVHDAIEPRDTARDGATRVTLARVDSRGGGWFGEALYKQLVFNGKPAVENGASYQEITFAAGSAAGDLDAVADRIAKSSPTILVLLGDGAQTAAIVGATEARSHGDTRKPIYVVADGSTEQLAPFVGASKERRRRVFAIITDSTQTANARFVMRFEAAHPGEASRTLNPGTTYEGFYLLAYSAFALGAKPITGPALARTFSRLNGPGRAIESGPSDVFDAIGSLAKGETIALSGPSGAIDLDPKTGETTNDFALLCPAVDRAGRAIGDVESGVVFRTRTGAVEGTVRCP